MARGILDPLLRHVRHAADLPAGGPLPDRDLIERFLVHRDQEAFAALMRRHARLVLSACRHVLTDESDVEDAFQATFLVLLRRAGSIRWQPSVGSWLYGVAHRVACQARANANARRQREERRAARTPESAPPADLSWREACGVLHEELDRLPDRYRLPLLLCYLEGLSRDEAARRLGWSAGAVKGCLERGRDQLRRRLQRRGVTLSAGLLATLAAPAVGVPPEWLDASLRLIGPGRPPTPIAELASAHLRHSPLATPAFAVAAALIAVMSVGLAGPARPADGLPAALNAVQPEPARSITVRGRVLDPGGRVVAGANLYLLPRDFSHPAGADAAPVRATTDAAGRFEFAADEPPEATTVVAVREGFGLDWHALDARAPELTLRLVRDDVPIRGRVLDLEGRPVAGSIVQVTHVHAPDHGDLTRYLQMYRTLPGSAGTLTEKKRVSGLHAVKSGWSATTGADGRFEVRGVGGERSVGVSISGPGLEAAQVEVLTRPGVDVRTLPRPGTPGAGYWAIHGPTFDHLARPERPVQGTVRDRATGQPIAGVEVAGGMALGTAGAKAVTNAEGHYRLRGLGSGKLLLAARPAPGQPFLADSRAAGDGDEPDPVTADFALTRGVLISGRIRDRVTGRPVRGVIDYEPLPGNPWIPRSPEADGRFDGYRLTFADADGGFRIVGLPGPGVLVVGVHRDAERRSPAGYQLAELPSDERFRAAYSAKDRAFRNGRGAIVPVGGAAAVRVIDPNSATTDLACDIDLSPGRTLTGTVLDPDGRPLSGVHLSGLGVWDGPAELPTAEFTVKCFGGRPRRLHAFHAERQLAVELALRGDEQGPLTLQLGPAAAVRGRLLDGAGKPIAGAIAVLDRLAAAGESYELSPEQFAFADAEGRFQFLTLLPGHAQTLHLRRHGRSLRVGVNAWLPNGVPIRWVPQPGHTYDLGDLTVRPTGPA